VAVELTNHGAISHRELVPTSRLRRRQSDRNCTDAHLEKHISKLRDWEMVYKVAVHPNPSQNNSTSPEAGRGWKQSPNADDGDKDTATRQEMYIKPTPQERRDGSTNEKEQPSTQLKDVRSDQDTPSPPNNNNKKKRSTPSSLKLNKKGGDTLPLIPTTPHRLHIHMPAPCAWGRFEQTCGFATRLTMPANCGISIVISFHRWRRL
jgi:hypothetical protein